MSAWDISENASLNHTVLQVREHGRGIWILTMAAPPSTHNTLSPLLMGALARAVDRISSLGVPKARVIILEAAGKSFSAGIDINIIRDEPNLELKMIRAIDPTYAIQESKVPVIACVRGAAYTGGFELALSCDIRLASEDAVFRDNHAMYGVHPTRGISQILPRDCGSSNAKLASLASFPIPASLALQWNLVSQVVKSPEDLLPAALIIAEAIVYNSAPLVTSLKNTIDEGGSLPYGEARKFELKREAQYYEGMDSEGLADSLTEGAIRFNQRVAELGGGDVKLP
ncbi:ClpP/crotonase-like domain-containing protein [Aspergillus stella-maris]|uniref:ClpP/crotonase-like domain-containing protein n=1 Tax=Aspergillus stella-maris TaxID=1810926 RepID=UPI003CCCD38D